MFKEFLLPLVKYFTGLNIFSYITFRAVYAAITALFISFLAGPSVIRLLSRLRFGQSVREDGPKSHQVKSGTPTMGGVLIIISVVLSLLLWQDLRSWYSWVLIVTFVSFGILGFVDDYLKITRRNSVGLRSYVKLGGQLLLSFAVVMMLYLKPGAYTTSFFVPFLKNPLFDMGWLFVPWGIFIIVGTSNAVNLTDGLDGLAISLTIIALVAFGVITYVTGHVRLAEYLYLPYISGLGEVTVIILGLMGASAGFLWFNCHPAEIFMGDSGSLSLGAFLGVLALLVKQELLLILIGGVFVIETGSVILQVASYKLRGKRIFKMAPIHHHFELSGWGESKVVMRLILLGCIFAMIGLSTLKIR